MPAMDDEIIKPKILWRHTRIIVSEHFSVICLEPYLQSKKIMLNTYLTPLQRNICHFGICKGGSVEETVLAEILPEIVE